MIAAVAHDPDGKVVRRVENGKVHFIIRTSEARCLRTAVKEWWVLGALRQDPPPLGATVHIGVMERRPARPGELVDDHGLVFVGQPGYRFDRVPIVDPETDEVVGTECVWIDLQVERQAAVDAEALAAAKVAYAARKAGAVMAPKAGK